MKTPSRHRKITYAKALRLERCWLICSIMKFQENHCGQTVASGSFLPSCFLICNLFSFVSVSKPTFTCNNQKWQHFTLTAYSENRVNQSHRQLHLWQCVAHKLTCSLYRSLSQKPSLPKAQQQKCQIPYISSISFFTDSKHE